MKVSLVRNYTNGCVFWLAECQTKGEKWSREWEPKSTQNMHSLTHNHSIKKHCFLSSIYIHFCAVFVSIVLLADLLWLNPSTNTLTHKWNQQQQQQKKTSQINNSNGILRQEVIRSGKSQCKKLNLNQNSGSMHIPWSVGISICKALTRTHTLSLAPTHTDIIRRTTRLICSYQNPEHFSWLYVLLASGFLFLYISSFLYSFKSNSFSGFSSFPPSKLSWIFVSLWIWREKKDNITWDCKYLTLCLTK